ncbi:hypothetical protein PDE_00846 [Penicillium oxalicum 114-2]|uniref:Uncharacterized protein n=1 Tax=Penicillium oxalicum (strain 114-2 / CGMCC 5302) TaxID=933388 RepID=S7Z5X4_PENO1|nr:hypothetical protein PDE_00846 [Penicillium oxalicum 114-2]
MAIQYICFKEGTPIGRRRQKKRFKPDIHPVVDVDGIVPHRVTSHWNLLLTGRGYDRLSAEAMTVVRVAVGKLPPPPVQDPRLSPPRVSAMRGYEPPPFTADRATSNVAVAKRWK